MLPLLEKNKKIEVEISSSKKGMSNSDVVIDIGETTSTGVDDETSSNNSAKPKHHYSFVSARSISSVKV